MELREVVARAIAESDRNKESDATFDCLWASHGYRTSCMKHAQAALQAIQDAGYAIVPVEPTEEMRDPLVLRGVDLWNKRIFASDMRLIYKAMIAAFPTSTPSASDGECNRSDSKESA